MRNLFAWFAALGVEAKGYAVIAALMLLVVVIGTAWHLVDALGAIGR